MSGPALIRKMPQYVFAVFASERMFLKQHVDLPECGFVGLYLDFDYAKGIADLNAENSGHPYSVIPLKTPDWRGICGNCGKPWVPDCSQSALE